MDLVLALVSIVVLSVDKPSQVLAGSSQEDRVEPLPAIVVNILAGLSPEYLGTGLQLHCILRKWCRTFGSVALVVGVECYPFLIVLIKYL